MSEMMQFEYVATSIGVLLLVLLYLAYRFLASPGWVMGWIQGNLGLALLLLCGVLGLSIMDIRTYRPMFDDRPIGTLSVHTLGPGSHQLRYVNSKGIEQSYLIAGDRYSIAVRQFRWGVRYAGMGMGHGYRLDHLIVTSSDGSGRDEVRIASSDKVDVWQFYRSHLPGGFLFTAEMVETSPRAVVDGGMYELIPQAFDINLAPLNQVAKEAEAQTAPTEIPPTTTVEDAVPAATPAPEVPANPVSSASPTPAAAPTPPATSTPTVMTQGKIIRNSPGENGAAKPDNQPGAHLQATPATVIEAPQER